MEIKSLTNTLSVSGQIKLADLKALAQSGFKTVINNRPDGEVPRQIHSETLAKRAEELGLTYHFIPVISGLMTETNIEDFKEVLASVPKPALAFCRTGTRSTILWAHARAGNQPSDTLINAAKSAGYDLSNLKSKLDTVRQKMLFSEIAHTKHTVVIIGGGSAGIATAASMLKRRPKLDIAIIEPSETHYYQPGWTMVGGGIFKAEDTQRKTCDLVPTKATWIKDRVATFHPEQNSVMMKSGQVIAYDALVVAPGLHLDFQKIEGLEETLGKNGVTSNYKYDLAPYTWELVKDLKGGTAIFTQPPMPIKCAGAPQKAMYLSGDHWFKSGVLKDIRIDFCNAGGAIFGVKEYVPALMEYVEKYRVNLNFGENLVKVDGPSKTAWFEKTDANGNKTRVERKFDILHVCPPQSAPEFIKTSPLANAAGWVDIDAETLRHVQYTNIYSLGDAGSSPNAKTMAAARKQAPVVATNVIAKLEGKPKRAVYDGYGSCPLTVERGKVVLAEFLYNGKVAPSFPTWLIDGTRPSKLSWLLKARLLPPIYWKAMLKGKEWLVKTDPNSRTEITEK